MRLISNFRSIALFGLALAGIAAARRKRAA